MLRDISLAVALLAFASVASAGGADCGDSHGAKQAITEDQAQATPVPVKKAAAPAAKKKTVACEGNCADRSKQPAQDPVALARSTPTSTDKPVN